MSLRRSARVILLSPDAEVLLIRFVVRRSIGEFEFWATPGGEVEGAESDREAAERELHEELGLTLRLEGPVHVASSVFEHQAVIVSNTDVFFTAQCAREAPCLRAPTEDERAAMRECRWWRLDEIVGSDAKIFPDDLETEVRRLLR
jgi:ADP-ribose pyrophosphatase YjhB (NUDIX family)